MGHRIRKQKIGNNLPFVVIFSADLHKIDFRKEATSWCKSSSIKHQFHISSTRYDEIESDDTFDRVSLIYRILKGATSARLSSTVVITTNIIFLDKKYATFRFEDQADAALFKMFWS